MPNVLIKKRFNSWLIMLTCGLFYCYQFALRVLPNTLAQEFMDVFHVEAAGFGIIIASYSAAYAGLQIPLGITIDRIQIKYLLPIAPLLCALGALGLVYSDNIVYAAASRFVMGIGSAFGFIGAVKVATIILPSNKVGIGIGMTIFFGTLGAILAGTPLKALTHIFDWKTIILCMVFIGVVLSLILFMALSSVLIELKQKHVLAVKNPILKDFKLILKNPQIILLSVYGMLTYLPITVLGAGWGIGFIMVYFEASYTIAANAIAFMFIGAGIGSPIIAILSDVLKSRKIVMLVSSVVACILYTAILYGNFNMLEYQIYICLFLAGIFYSAKTLSFALACDLVDKRTSALTTSIINMTVMLAGLIFHPLIGYILNKGHVGAVIYTKYDYRIALSVLPISALIAFILIVFIKDYKLGKNKNFESALISIDE